MSHKIRDDLASTGRIVLQAFFGDTDVLVDQLREELMGADEEARPLPLGLADVEARARAQATRVRTAPPPPPPAAAPAAAPIIDVQGYSFVSCAGCGRQHSIAENVEVSVIERIGWRFSGGAWRCRFCVK